MKPATETSGEASEHAHEFLTTTDVQKTIGVLQRIIDSKKAVNVKGLQERIRDLHARLNDLK
jgi:hypothetical protein